MLRGCTVLPCSETITLDNGFKKGVISGDVNVLHNSWKKRGVFFT